MRLVRHIHAPNRDFPAEERFAWPAGCAASRQAFLIGSDTLLWRAKDSGSAADTNEARSMLAACFAGINRLIRSPGVRK